MKRYVFLVGVMTSLLVTMASISYASINLNSSRSNIYRLTFDTSVVSSTEAAAILAELDKAHPRGDATEATVQTVLRKHLGKKYESIQKLTIQPAAGPGKLTSIIILKNPGDLPAAIAVSDPGTPSEPSKKGTTSKQ